MIFKKTIVNQIKFIKEVNCSLPEQIKQFLKEFFKTFDNLQCEDYKFIELSVEATKETLCDICILEK